MLFTNEPSILSQCDFYFVQNNMVTYKKEIMMVGLNDEASSHKGDCMTLSSITSAQRTSEVHHYG